MVDGSWSPHFYVPNHRGDTMQVLNSSRAEEAKIRYDAFGNPMQQTGTFSPRYTFSTKEYLSGGNGVRN